MTLNIDTMLFDESQFIKVEGNHLHFVDKGEGVPIIFIHGLFSCCLTWRLNINILSDYFRIILIDLPGFGHSQGAPNFNYGYEGYADLIKKFMADLGIDKAHLVGHSFGGSICEAVLKRYPIATGSLVLISSSNFKDHVNCQNKKILSNLPLFMYKKKEFISQDVLKIYKYMQDKQSSDVKDVLLKNLCEHGFNGRKHKYLNKCLIIWGEKDFLIPFQYALEIQQSFSNSRIKIIPNCAHAPHEECSDQINEALIDFF